MVQPPAVVLPGMVGRERERAELVAAVEDARNGRGRAAILLGEAGMGKSTLAGWLAAYAVTVGFGVARGSCSAAGMPPLWPWRRALDGLVPMLPWRSEGAASAPSDREFVAAATVEAIAGASRHMPLLVVIEDLHWSDPASLVVARAVAEAAGGLSVTVVYTSRDDPNEVAPQIRDQLAALPAGVRRMPLPPLDLAEVARLGANGLGHQLSDDAVRDLHTRTGGNPFFVHEVTRLMAAHGRAAALVVPPGVREVLQRRLARLSQSCASFITAAAIAAETSAEVIEDDLACAVSGEDEASGARLMDEAVTANLLDVDPAAVLRYRFRHALVREVLAQGVSGAERGRLHARVAASLEDRADKLTLASRLAHHWSRATGAAAKQRAAVWSLLAARDAMAGFSFESAAVYFARALTDSSQDRIAVSIELGEALQLSGDASSGRELLLSVAREASAVGRAADLAKAALALGGGLAGFEVTLHDEDQIDLLRQADGMLAPNDLALRAAVRGRLSLALAGVAPLNERVKLAEDAVEMASSVGDSQIECAVLAAYCDAIAGPDHVAERIVAASRMLNLSTAESTVDVRLQATVFLARRLLLVAYLEQGDFAAVAEQATAYERLARRIRVPRYAWLPEIWKGMRALLDGTPEIALGHADAAEEIGRRAQSLNAELMAFTVRTQAHLDRETPEEFAGDLNAVCATIGPAGMPSMYYAGPARALLAAGHAGRATAVLRAFLTGSAQTMPKDAEWLEAHWAMVDIALRLNDRPAATGLFEALLPYEHLWAVDGIGGAVFGTVAEQLGRLALYLGRQDEASRYLSTALERYIVAGTPALRDRVDAMARRAPEGSIETRRLRRAGQVWVVEWAGRRSMVPDSKGVRDLAVLLARPGHAVPALDLVEAAGGPPAAAAGADLGPALDDTARRAYRRRLTELDHDLDEAEANADLGWIERLRTERSMIADELNAALGLGGRARIAGDPAERARKAVTMRIRAAIKAISAHDEALARHLRNTVRTGRMCSYEPETPVGWQS